MKESAPLVATIGTVSAIAITYYIDESAGVIHPVVSKVPAQ